jgi:predicted esterase
MGKLREAVYATAAPTLMGLTYDAEDSPGVDQVFEGTYASPNYQVGDSPYTAMGGQIALDGSGKPVVQRTEMLRVAMTIPEGTMPATGWPVVIYAHGTGGDYKSFIGDGSGKEAAKITDKSGAVIARLAMISIDQVLHGPRAPAGTNVDLAFFNVQNLRAARANPKQGALDDFQLLRLVRAIDVASAPTTGQRIKFDPDRIYFKGHSQGSLTGPLFLAVEPEVKAAVLSGAGGELMLALLNKKKPLDIPAVVGALLHDPADEFHPMLNLIQSYMEDADPVNYARLLFREPPASFSPKSIYQSLGITDNYTPIPAIKALGLAMGVQPVNPMREPIDNLDLDGLSWGQAPVSKNVAAQAATGVLLEYPQAAGSDGHFVVFDVPDATAQSNRFLGTAAATGTAQLLAP